MLFVGPVRLRTKTQADGALIMLANWWAMRKSHT